MKGFSSMMMIEPMRLAMVCCAASATANPPTPRLAITE